MSVKIPPGPQQPECIGLSAEPLRSEEMKPLEQKVEEVGKRPLGILPEAPPAPLTQREITKLLVPLPKDLSEENLNALLTSIMIEKGISFSVGTQIEAVAAQPGIETVAARRLNEGINVLLEGASISPLCPKYDVQSGYVNMDAFHNSKVDIIFAEEGITITGIKEEQLPAFLEELRKIQPDLHERVTAFKGKVCIVSKEMVGKTEQIADDRFSEIATELRDRAVEAKKKVETQIQEPSALEESFEEGRVVESAEREVPENKEEVNSDAKEIKEEVASEKGIEEHHSAAHVTRTSVEAALIDKVAGGILYRVVELGIANAHVKSERHIQEERVKERLEREEVHKEELKGKEKQERIMKEQEIHYEQEQAVEKSEAQKFTLSEKTVSREIGRQEEHHAIGEYQEKQKEGIPIPPPSIPRA
jgi:hypothetical protein